MSESANSRPTAGDLCELLPSGMNFPTISIDAEPGFRAMLAATWVSGNLPMPSQGVFRDRRAELIGRGSDDDDASMEALAEAVLNAHLEALVRGAVEQAKEKERLSTAGGAATQP